jgi:threonylcarbamoyladenosine tRNA methylthiotransferase MtaB
MGKKTVAFITLGCKVNIAETEGMKKLFREAGYEIVDAGKFADVYVVNTCTVTSMSDKKSRQMLRRAHSINPNAVVAAVGCFAQVWPDQAEKIEGVNLVVGNNLKHKIVDLVEEAHTGKSRKYIEERSFLKDFEELPIDIYEGHTRAFLKVQDGCNQFCSYCIIPYARGPVRSRSVEDVISQAERFAAQGYKEIVLTGIHLTSYRDEHKDAGLSSLIRKVHAVDGIERIRLGSLEPMFLTHELISSVNDLPKLCPHFHISLQSGSRKTLERMNRKYTPDEYKNIVMDLRAQIPNVTVTTDVMVGFPGETEDEFLESYNFCNDIGFLWMHVFKYSPRKGTPAAGYKDQIGPSVKEERSREMIALAENMRKCVFQKFDGWKTTVLLEKEIQGKPGYMEGLTPNYIPVEVQVNNEKPGEIVDIRLKYKDSSVMKGIR